MNDDARTLGALGLLTLALPLNAALTGVALLRGALRTTTTPAPRPAGARRTVLVSGGKMTKALVLARAFHAAGHRVVLVEAAKYRWTGHRASRAVDAFHVVPAPDAPGYVQAMVDVVRAEGVDVYVPVCSPAASHFDALVAEALRGECEVVHGDPPTIDALDDKATFSELARSLGLGVPESRRITHPDQLLDLEPPAAGGHWVLKSIPYDPVNRLDLTPLPRPTREEAEAFAAAREVSEAHPWVLQEFVAGTELCTHGTARAGRLRVSCVCESSAFQLNYEHVEDPEVDDWVRTFVAGLGLTGQYAFDLIRADADGRVLAIECNPRTHSAITMFHDQLPEVAAAYLEDEGPEVRPSADGRPTYWLYQELWRLLRHPGTWRERGRVLRRGTDAIFSWEDPLPFLLVHHRQIPALLLADLRARRGWLKIDFNIGKLVEAGGD